MPAAVPLLLPLGQVGGTQASTSADARNDNQHVCFWQGSIESQFLEANVGSRHSNWPCFFRVMALSTLISMWPAKSFLALFKE
jgi:hypothetical protein